jgi:hypothetical protein
MTASGTLLTCTLTARMSVSRGKDEVGLLGEVTPPRLDFGAQDWYTRRHRACKKCLILLSFCDRRGNPSLSATSVLSRPSKLAVSRMSTP